MVKFRSKPDQELVTLIKTGNESVLIHLFERNYLDARLFLQKFDVADKEISNILVDSVLTIWEYFSTNTWVESRHKLDFMVFHNVQKIYSIRSGRQIKFRHQFDELDTYNNVKTNTAQAKHKIVDQFFFYLPDTAKQIMGFKCCEKWHFVRISKNTGLGSENKIEKTYFKSMVTLMDRITMNMSIKTFLSGN